MKKKLFVLILGAGIIASACTKYPPSSDRLLEDLVVMTQYDTKVDFNKYKTFTVAENVVKITGKDTTTIDNTVAQAVLDQIRANMISRGFVEVSGPIVPDFGLDVIYYENTYITAYYGGWWGGYYDPWWGYYYPYYPTYYSTYTSGTALIELIDLKYPQNNKLYIRWNAYIRGLLTGYHTTSEITHAVDQAFIQTPQISTNQ